MSRYIRTIFIILALFNGSILVGQDGKYIALFIVKASESVEWKDRDSKIKIGILGTSSFYGYLEELVEVRKNLTLLQIDDLSEVKSCNVIFVSGTETNKLKELARMIGKSSILVISDNQQQVGNGADMGLFREEGKLQFVYSEASVSSKGIKISSQLTDLARSL